MIEVENWLIPFVGYRAMTIWPFLFVRDDLMVGMRPVDYNHECIHGWQQIEMLLVALVIAAVMAIFGCGWWSLAALPLFFYWYLVEWIIRLFVNGSTAYRNVSFEQEAYLHERDAEYPYERKPFAWLGYLFCSTYKKK